MSKKLTTIPESSARLPTGGVAAHFNVTPRSIDRWWKNPELNFPQPIFINKRKYWSLTDLEKWERERARTQVQPARAAQPAHSDAVA